MSLKRSTTCGITFPNTVHTCINRRSQNRSQKPKLALAPATGTGTGAGAEGEGEVEGEGGVAGEVEGAVEG